MITPEARPEQSPSGEPLIFHLTHVGNQKVIDNLTLFRQEGMKGSRAAFHLLSLFGPLPVGGDDMGLIKSGEIQPQTLWDQVGWIYANPQILTEEQKGTRDALQYFPLESLANNPQVRRVGGEPRDLSQKARQMAKDVFEEYSQTLDPDNPESVKAFKTIRAFGKATPLVIETIALAVLAACAANIKATPTINSETPTATIPAIAQVYPEAVVIPTPVEIPPPAFEQDQRLTENEDWFQDLQESLGSDYRIENNVLYYHDPRTSRDNLVLLKFYDNVATFNVGPDSKAGKETVRWVSRKHFYVRSELDNLLVAVDSDGRVSTFNTLSGFWQEDKLGNRKIMYYALGRDGFYHIIIYDPATNMRIDSLFVINATSGDLVQLP